jgi:hypothetical protein
MTNITIRRLGVLSVAKMEGLIMLVVGLIIGVVYGLIFMIWGAVLSSLLSRSDNQVAALGGVTTVVIGVVIMVAVPIFYGTVGFIGGAIGALIYNGAARIVGGIQIELEGPPPYAPPAPQQWAAR